MRGRGRSSLAQLRGVDDGCPAGKEMREMESLIDPRELAFQLYEMLDVESLTARSQFNDHSRETFDAALEASRRLAEERFRPHYHKSDAEEPRIVDGRVRLIPEIGAAVEAFARSGLLCAGRPYSQGGMQLPWTVAQACYAHFHAANVSTFAYCFLSIAAANLLEVFGSSAQKRRYMEPLLSGRYLGTMCLSEPHAGSSLADIRTRAIPQGDGRYRIRGSKMWISGGEHELTENIVHLVLARSEGAPAGVKGISLFVVPRRRIAADGGAGGSNGVSLAGLNHKMGYRGTVNTALNFGESAECIGELVGEPNCGLAHMFHMMNEARVVVGMSAAALGLAGYRVSLDYARQRPQGRTVHSKDPASPQAMIIEHSDVRRLLIEQKVYAEGALALGLYCARLVDEQKSAEQESEAQRAGLLLDILTPIMKAWSSDWCLRANSNAIQVLGGAGYTRDFPVEQIYRDNRLNPIHEGTNGIQAIDLLGRKAWMDGGIRLRLLIAAIREDAMANAGREEVKVYADRLLRAVGLAEKVTKALLAGGNARSNSATLGNASLYLDLLGHVVIGWMWLRQAACSAVRLHASGAEVGNFYRGKLHAAGFFFRRELPAIEHKASLLMAMDDSCESMRNEWF